MSQTNKPDAVRPAAPDAQSELRLALVYLVNECGGSLGICSHAFRQEVGNTNVACLELRIKEARELLDRIPAASESLLPPDAERAAPPSESEREERVVVARKILSETEDCLKLRNYPPFDEGTRALLIIRIRGILLEAALASAPAAQAESSPLEKAAREGWMRACVFYMDMDAEAPDSPYVAEMNKRWPL